jgi:hypothetical protein
MTVDWNSTLKIYITAFAAFLATYALISITNLQPWPALITGGIVYFFIYVIGLPLSGALRKSDVTQLQGLIEGLGPIGKFGRFLFSLLDKYIRA